MAKARRANPYFINLAKKQKIVIDEAYFNDKLFLYQVTIGKGINNTQEVTASLKEFEKAISAATSGTKFVIKLNTNPEKVRELKVKIGRQTQKEYQPSSSSIASGTTIDQDKQYIVNAVRQIATTTEENIEIHFEDAFDESRKNKLIVLRKNNNMLNPPIKDENGSITGYDNVEDVFLINFTQDSKNFDGSLISQDAKLSSSNSFYASTIETIFTTEDVKPKNVKKVIVKSDKKALFNSIAFKDVASNPIKTNETTISFTGGKMSLTPALNQAQFISSSGMFNYQSKEQGFAGAKIQYMKDEIVGFNGINQLHVYTMSAPNQLNRPDTEEQITQQALDIYRNVLMKPIWKGISSNIFSLFSESINNLTTVGILQRLNPINPNTYHPSAPAYVSASGPAASAPGTIQAFSNYFSKCDFYNLYSDGRVEICKGTDHRFHDANKSLPNIPEGKLLHPMITAMESHRLDTVTGVPGELMWFYIILHGFKLNQWWKTEEPAMLLLKSALDSTPTLNIDGIGWSKIDNSFNNDKNLDNPSNGDTAKFFIGEFDYLNNELPNEMKIASTGSSWNNYGGFIGGKDYTTIAPVRDSSQDANPQRSAISTLFNVGQATPENPWGSTGSGEIIKRSWFQEDSKVSIVYEFANPQTITQFEFTGIFSFGNVTFTFLDENDEIVSNWVMKPTQQDVLTNTQPTTQQIFIG